jgi:cleavage stimulation factor subunit 3
VVGVDKECGAIWADYLEFVKSSQVDVKWKEQQKMDQTRKIYQRAVCLPLENLETLWQGYNTFENQLNKATVSFTYFQI